MEIKYLDIHSHFNLPQFDADLEAAIAKIEEKGTATICVGTSLQSSKRAIEIADLNPNIWATIGQHPTDTDEEFDSSAFLTLAGKHNVVAIGECGFDFYRLSKDTILPTGETVFAKQKALFEEQIKIARHTGKPLMIHARPSKPNSTGESSMDAYEAALDILSHYPDVRANFHFFVGDAKIAKRAHEAGHTMSFDGPITFTREYDETIKSLPLSAIMAETDSPYAAPEPYRTLLKQTRADGKITPARAEPWMVEEVYKTIAKIRGEDEEMVRLALLENAKQFFKILL